MEEGMHVCKVLRDGQVLGAVALTAAAAHAVGRRGGLFAQLLIGLHCFPAVFFGCKTA